jgi:hypothetical protein
VNIKARLEERYARKSRKMSEEREAEIHKAAEKRSGTWERYNDEAPPEYSPRNGHTPGSRMCPQLNFKLICCSYNS